MSAVYWYLPVAIASHVNNNYQEGKIYITPQKSGKIDINEILDGGFQWHCHREVRE